MRSEISINLGSTDENFDVRRSHTDSGGTHWISFHREQHGNAMEFTAFGSPDELDAFIDQIAALRTKVDEPVSAAA
jgi:hypothetical protein